MTTAGKRVAPDDNQRQDSRLPVFRPPLIAPFPPGFRAYDEHDETPRGDQSVVLDGEDERILDRAWAKVAQHPVEAGPRENDATLVPPDTSAEAAQQRLAAGQDLPFDRTSQNAVQAAPPAKSNVTS